jgi:purine-binding chemotaxis protein CheW
MRTRLGLQGETRTKAASIALHIDLAAESYGLVVDGVGEVLALPDAAREANPANLDKLFASVSAGVHRLEDRLMVVLDIDRVLDVSAHRLAA